MMVSKTIIKTKPVEMTAAEMGSSGGRVESSGGRVEGSGGGSGLGHISD